MKTRLVLATLFIPLFTSQSFANDSSVQTHEATKEATIGLGVGSVTGGIIGGPLGLMIGAFTGALVGNSVNNDKQIESLNSELEQSNTNVNALQKSNTEQALALKDAKTSIEKLLTQNQDLELESLEFAVQFRTNSSDIEKHYTNQLFRLAEILTKVPDVEINVAGFADRMGDEAYNMELSGRRAAVVKEFLIQQGIDEKRILAHAYGESKPIKPSESLENNFFDRRVSISLKTLEADKGPKLSVASH